jgi:MSHA biogenesis protein MshP
MMHRHIRTQPGHSACAQRGFALVSGIFLITILFLLSAYMMGFRGHQDSSFTLDTLGTRAFAAAQAGAEWGLYGVLRTGTCTAASSIALEGTLAGYTATVTCTRMSFDEGGSTVNVDAIVSNACNQPSGGSCPNSSPGANYVERHFTVSAAQP